MKRYTLEGLKGSFSKKSALPRMARHGRGRLNRGVGHVLVVDDEEPIRDLLHRQLSLWGYHVKTVPSAIEALKSMRDEPAAIVLIDLRMPGDDGLWLTERITEQWPKTAVVIVTAADDIDVIESTRHLGIVGYVKKPFERETLRLVLERAAMAADE